jgi:hypothetical protein
MHHAWSICRTENTSCVLLVAGWKEETTRRHIKRIGTLHMNAIGDGYICALATVSKLPLSYGRPEREEKNLTTQAMCSFQLALHFCIVYTIRQGLLHTRRSI